MDSKVIKEAKQSCFKRPVPSITQLKQQQAKLRREIS
jgi:hypothetical protein